MRTNYQYEEKDTTVTNPLHSFFSKEYILKEYRGRNLRNFKNGLKIIPRLGF